jgi:predicted NAD-dependent protein-ADP-ribosyltransferase YbiA (DUF1768 family)
MAAILFPFHKTAKNGRFSRFSPFPLYYQGKRQRTREKAHCGRFLTIPDQKDKRKNAYNMKRSCLKKA